MRDDRSPWIWIVMLAIGVVAVAIVVVGLLADDGGGDDGTRGAGKAIVVVTEDGNEGMSQTAKRTPARPRRSRRQPSSRRLRAWTSWPPGSGPRRSV